MATIKAPNREYNGRIGDVVFESGEAETDDLAVIAYCRQAGYEVDGRTDNPPAVPEPVDPRAVTVEQVGGPLRDAAVDPQPADFLPPVGAGQANPHGSQVVAPGIHAVSGPGPIVPGPVDGDQEARETEAAERVLAGDELVPEVTAELAEARKVEPPAGNASADEWRTYAVEHHGADPEQVASMRRDELREQYGTPTN